MPKAPNHTRGSSQQSALVALLGVTLFVSLVPGCNDSATRMEHDLARLEQLAPGLQRPLLEAALADDERICEVLRTHSFYLPTNTYIALRNCLLSDSLAASDSLLLARVLWPIVTHMSHDLGHWSSSHELAHLSRPGWWPRTRELLAQRDSLLSDTSLTRESKITRLDSLMHECDAMDFTIGASVLATELAHLAREQGRGDQAVHYLRLSAAYAESSGAARMRAQTLATFGIIFAIDSDSFLVYNERALNIAIRARIPDQAARVSMRLATRANHTGRSAQVIERTETARRLFEELGGDISLRAGYNPILNMYASLNCWDLVSQTLDSFATLPEPLNPNNLLTSDISTLHELQALYWRALLAMVRGETDTADSIYRSIVPQFGELRNRHDVQYHTMRAWALGLIQNGRLEDAIPILEDCLRLIEERQLLHVNRLDTCRLLARAALSTENDYLLPDLDACLGDTLSRQGAHHFHFALAAALQTQIAWRLGQTARAHERLREALYLFASYLGRTQPSPTGYLALADGHTLHTALLQMYGDGPRSVYEIELAWLSNVDLLGRGTDTHLPERPRIDLDANDRLRLPVDARPLSQWLASSHGMHLVFIEDHNDLVRITASAETLRCDTLAISRRELRKRVASAVATISRPDARSAFDGPIAELSELLLPESLHRPDNSTPVIVTATGVLSELPFAALHVGTGPEYEPLQACHDVVRLRLLRPETATTTGSALVIGDPVLSPVIARRYPFLRLLPGSRDEAERVARHLMDVDVLLGDKVTKEHVLARWEDARYIYAATHVVRHAENPYLAFLPMSGGAASLDSLMIDVLDVRRADLSRCELVVLSGCESGASPLAIASPPSLGDAFIDAGAGAVVQTYWRVEDEAARAFMTSFIDAWLVERKSPTQALNEVRRRYSKDEHGNYRHPYFWAAYDLQLARPPRSATGEESVTTADDG